MPHWLIKSATHHIISLLPWRHRWNELLQTWVSKSLALGPQRFEQRLEYCQRHLTHFWDSRSKQTREFSAFELGTGWYPVVPVGLYLCGASEIWTADVAPHLRRARVQRALTMFCEYDERGQLRKLLPAARPERMAALRKALDASSSRSPEASLQELNIHALVRDAQQTGLRSGSIDLFFSNGVLEYIPRPVLAHILTEFKRLAKSEAVFSNYIVLGDEYAQFDRSITPFNFLKFSDRSWRFLDSPLTRKSRLRISDYREVFAKAGWQILREENLSGADADLDRIRLAPQFQHYSRADLLVIRSWLVARL